MKKDLELVHLVSESENRIIAISALQGETAASMNAQYFYDEVLEHNKTFRAYEGVCKSIAEFSEYSFCCLLDPASRRKQAHSSRDFKRVLFAKLLR